MERKMVAKFAGKCRECGRRIEVRSMILWSREAGARHLVCETAPAPAPAPAKLAYEAAVAEIREAAERYATRGGELDRECEEAEFERLYFKRFGRYAA